jgi:hypothetical protein
LVTTAIRQSPSPLTRLTWPLNLSDGWAKKYGWGGTSHRPTDSGWGHQSTSGWSGGSSLDVGLDSGGEHQFGHGVGGTAEQLRLEAELHQEPGAIHNRACQAIGSVYRHPRIGEPPLPRFHVHCGILLLGAKVKEGQGLAARQKYPMPAVPNCRQ